MERTLGGVQSEEGRQTFWNPEKGEGDPPSHFGSSIASQPLVPCQAVMRPLGPRDHRRGRSGGSLESWLYLDLQVLAMQAQAGMPLVPSAPVPPEKWI